MIIKGIKRLDRWLWAKQHKLNPPDIVKELIESNPNDPDYNQR
jgi:hypothetical protein